MVLPDLNIALVQNRCTFGSLSRGEGWGPSMVLRRSKYSFASKPTHFWVVFASLYVGVLHPAAERLPLTSVEWDAILQILCFAPFRT